MVLTFDLPAHLQTRLDSIVARSNLSVSAIVADALQNGRSLDWQERFLDRVTEGVAAADRGDFATLDDLTRVIRKYRPI